MDEMTIRLTNGVMHWWLSLPTTKEALNYALDEMGATIDNVHIDRCRDGMGGKLESLIVDAEVGKVNYLAMRLIELSPVELGFISALMERTDRPRYIDSLINLTNNLETCQLTEYANETDFNHHLGMPPPTPLDLLTPTAHSIQENYDANRHILPDAYQIIPQADWRTKLDRNTANGHPMMYPYSKAVARQNGHFDLYTQNLTTNIQCVTAVERAVRVSGPKKAFQQVIEQFGCERVSALLAYTLLSNNDNPLSDYRVWAMSIRRIPTSPDDSSLIIDIPPNRLELCINWNQKEQENHRDASANKPSIINQIRSINQSNSKAGDRTLKRNRNLGNHER